MFQMKRFQIEFLFGASSRAECFGSAYTVLRLKHLSGGRRIYLCVSQVLSLKLKSSSRMARTVEYGLVCFK